MTYYIYENWQAGAHKAVIHSGGCAALQPRSRAKQRHL